MDSKLEEKELEDIGDFISAAITRRSQFANPEQPAIGQFADRDQKQGDAIDHSVKTGDPLFTVTQPETRCHAFAITAGNDDTATLALKDDGLWLTLKTPRGSATFNLEFKLDYHDTRKSSVTERVAVDYFKRIK